VNGEKQIQTLTCSYNNTLSKSSEARHLKQSQFFFPFLLTTRKYHEESHVKLFVSQRVSGERHVVVVAPRERLTTTRAILTAAIHFDNYSEQSRTALYFQGIHIHRVGEQEH